MLIKTATGDLELVPGLLLRPTLRQAEFEAAPVFNRTSLWNDGPHGVLYKIMDGYDDPVVALVALTFQLQELRLVHVSVCATPLDVIHWDTPTLTAPEIYQAADDVYTLYQFPWGTVQTMQYKGPHYSIVPRDPYITISYAEQQRLPLQVVQA